jgi:hypothetical protein
VSDQWSKPQARDHFPAHSPEYVIKKKAQGYGMRNLNDEAAHWPTPAARDYKGANSTEHVETNDTGRAHTDQLPNFVEHRFSHSPPSTFCSRTVRPLLGRNHQRRAVA